MIRYVLNYLKLGTLSPVTMVTSIHKLHNLIVDPRSHILFIALFAGMCNYHVRPYRGAIYLCATQQLPHIC